MIKLLFVLNVFRDAAVPNIILDLAPHLMSRFQIEILSLQPPDEHSQAVERCKKIGLKLETLAVHRLDIISTLKKLRKYLKRSKPHIIHSHHGRADIYSALCKPQDVTLITTFHNIRESHSYLTRFGYKLTDRRVDMRTAVSHNTRETWYGRGRLKSESRVVYNPVAPSRLLQTKPIVDVRKQFAVGPENNLILNTGRLIPQKGQEHLINIMRRIIVTRKDMKLLICGWGPLKARLTGLVAHYGLQNHIVLTGLVHDMNNLLTAADLFVSTSLFEGHSVGLIEAMAAGLPVVTTKIPSSCEFLTHRENAIIVEQNDEEGFAAAVLELLEDRNLRRRIVEAGLQTCNSLFSPEVVAGEYSSIYDAIARS